jgi:hypothetical protein
MDDDDPVSGTFTPSLPTTAVPVLLQHRHDVDQAIGWAISAMR